MLPGFSIMVPSLGADHEAQEQAAVSMDAEVRQVPATPFADEAEQGPFPDQAHGSQSGSERSQPAEQASPRHVLSFVKCSEDLEHANIAPR